MVKKGQISVVITVIKKKQIKKGQIRVVNTVVKKGQIRVVIAVI